MKKLNFLISLYLIPLKSILSRLINPNEENYYLQSEEEVEYLNENKDKNTKQSKKQKSKKEFNKQVFDIGDSLRILYKNYSSIDLGLFDLLHINRKEIINEYQVITIWEYLLNVKTGRNIELFGNNKLNYEEVYENKDKINLLNVGNNKETNNISLLNYLKASLSKIVSLLGFEFAANLILGENLNKNIEINEENEYINSGIDSHNQLKNKVFSLFSIITEYLKCNSKNIFPAAVLLISGIFNKINKYFLKIPKLNLLILACLLFSNINAAFYFYSKSLFFPSFLNFWLFINNLHDIYLSIVIIAGNNEKDFSIFYENNFKSEKIFYVKCFVITSIILLNKYFNLCYFNKFYFYLLEIFYLNIFKAFIFNYYKNSNLTNLQPYENFVGFMFGIINLIFTNGFYLINSAYGYQYDSYLFINNLYSIYLLTYLDDLIFSYKNNLGELYLEIKDSDQDKKNRIIFQGLKEAALKNKLLKSKKDLSNSKANISTDLDIILVLFILFMLMMSFIFDSFFAVFLSLYFFKIYKNNFLCFYSIKEKRIITSILLSLFLFFIFNTKFYNLYYINQIVAVNDERFILAIKLLLKLICLAITIAVFFFSKDFFSILNFYNYTSYKYIIEEGLTESKADLIDKHKHTNNKLNSFDYASSPDNNLINNKEKNKINFFNDSSANLNSFNNINKINFSNSSIFNSENFGNDYILYSNPVFDYGLNAIKNINIDIGINSNNFSMSNKSLNTNNSLKNNISAINKNQSAINNISKNNNSNNAYSNSNQIPNSNYNKYINEKTEENISQYARKINEIYNLNNSLDEIFCFSIEKSTSYINSILESINFSNNNSSKIDSVYIEFLITKSTKHVYLFGICLDYFLLYFNFWLGNFTIREENLNNYLFSGLLQIFKLGILLKLFFIIFEYSKSKTQIITIIILNCICFNRLITYNETNIIDYYILTLLINLNKVIYLYFVENSYLVNSIIFIFSLIEFRRNKEIFLLCFLVCCLSFKTLIGYFHKKLVYRKLSFIAFAVIFILLFMFIQQESLDCFYEYLQESIIWYLKIDVIGIFEYISFNSITIPSKYFGKEKRNYVYIQRSNFFEEYYTREFLKFFIRYKIIKMS